LEKLTSMDWVGCLNEADAAGGRFILLVEPATTALEPLVGALLLTRNGGTEKLWHKDSWTASRLGDAL
jgi:membrane protein